MAIFSVGNWSRRKQAACSMLCLSNAFCILKKITDPVFLSQQPAWLRCSNMIFSCQALIKTLSLSMKI